MFKDVIKTQQTYCKGLIEIDELMSTKEYNNEVKRKEEERITELFFNGVITIEECEEMLDDLNVLYNKAMFG